MTSKFEQLRAGDVFVAQVDGMIVTVKVMDTGPRSGTVHYVYSQQIITDRQYWVYPDEFIDFFSPWLLARARSLRRKTERKEA